MEISFCLINTYQGEAKESDYESDYESVRIRPKWTPAGSDVEVN